MEYVRLQALAKSQRRKGDANESMPIVPPQWPIADANGPNCQCPSQFEEWVNFSSRIAFPRLETITVRKEAGGWRSGGWRPGGWRPGGRIGLEAGSASPAPGKDKTEKS